MLFECGQFTNCTKYHLLCVAYCGVQTLSYLICILTAHENVTAQAALESTASPTIAAGPVDRPTLHRPLNHVIRTDGV